MAPLGGQIVLRENSFNRTLGDARVAVYAGLRIDNQHVVVEMKRFNGARNSAIGVTTIDARIGNNVSHPKTSNSDAIIARLIYTDRRQVARTKFATSYVPRLASIARQRSSQIGRASCRERV